MFSYLKFREGKCFEDARKDDELEAGRSCVQAFLKRFIVQLLPHSVVFQRNYRKKYSKITVEFFGGYMNSFHS